MKRLLFIFLGYIAGLTFHSSFSMEHSQDVLNIYYRLHGNTAVKKWLLQEHQDAALKQAQGWECKREKRVSIAQCPITSIAICPDDTTLIAGCEDGSIHALDLESGNLLWHSQAHAQAVSSIAISSDNKYYVTGSSDESIKIWDMKTGECVKELAAMYGRVNQVMLSQDSCSLVSSEQNGYQCFEFPNGAMCWHQTSPIFPLQINSDHIILSSPNLIAEVDKHTLKIVKQRAKVDNVLDIYLPNGKTFSLLEGPKIILTSKNNDTFAYIRSDGTLGLITLRDIFERQRKMNINLCESTVNLDNLTAMALGNDAARVVLGNKDGSVDICAVNNDGLVQKYAELNQLDARQQLLLSDIYSRVSGCLQIPYLLKKGSANYQAYMQLPLWIKEKIRPYVGLKKEAVDLVPVQKEAHGIHINLSQQSEVPQTLEEAPSLASQFLSKVKAYLDSVRSYNREFDTRVEVRFPRKSSLQIMLLAGAGLLAGGALMGFSNFSRFMKPHSWLSWGLSIAGSFFVGSGLGFSTIAVFGFLFSRWRVSNSLSSQRQTLAEQKKLLSISIAGLKRKNDVKREILAEIQAMRQEQQYKTVRKDIDLLRREFIRV